MIAEEQDALRCFGDGGPAPCEPRCVHLLFQEQAKNNPNATALVAGGTRTSYGELKRRSDQIAACLAASGIGPGARVAFRANRSAETVAAILGALSAGAAYVPLDPGWPEARVAAIVAEAGATYVDPKALLAGGETDQVLAEPTLDDLAYVLYTSGSSGRAKGVAVTHRNLAHSTGARPIVYGERVESFLLASPFSFDSSVAGLFWTLCESGTLVIPPDDFLEDLPALAQMLAAERVIGFGFVRMTGTVPGTLTITRVNCQIAAANATAILHNGWPSGLSSTDILRAEPEGALLAPVLAR